VLKEHTTIVYRYTSYCIKVHSSFSKRHCSILFKKLLVLNFLMVILFILLHVHNVLGATIKPSSSCNEVERGKPLLGKQVIAMYKPSVHISITHLMCFFERITLTYFI